MYPPFFSVRFRPQPNTAVLSFLIGPRTLTRVANTMSINVESVATAATELSQSIDEIAGQAGQAAAGELAVGF